jgi:hypothetical protein
MKINAHHNDILHWSETGKPLRKSKVGLEVKPTSGTNIFISLSVKEAENLGELLLKEARLARLENQKTRKI